MQITLYTIGKTNIHFIKQGLNHYTERVKRYVKFEVIELDDLKKTGKISETVQMKKEAELLEKSLPENAVIVLLDENGKLYTSVEFSNFLQKKMNSGIKHLVFVVGGPYGFDANFKKGKELIAFSKMTFPHDLIRLIFTEQLYRTFSILRNEPYHHK